MLSARLLLMLCRHRGRQGAQRIREGAQEASPCTKKPCHHCARLQTARFSGAQDRLGCTGSGEAEFVLCLVGVRVQGPGFRGRCVRFFKSVSLNADLHALGPQNRLECTGSGLRFLDVLNGMESQYRQ